MQLMALGKWSKVEKRWQMVVALRRPASKAASRAAGPQSPAQRPQPVRHLRKDSDH